jgi:hypothetical protein
MSSDDFAERNLSQDNKIWLIASGAAIALGSLLPWVSAGIFSFAGTEGDGVFTLIMGGVIVVLALVGKTSRGVATLVICLAVLSGLIVANVASNLADIEPNDLITARPGGGLWLVGAGALAAVAAGSKTWSEAKVQEQSTQEAVSLNDSTE